MLKLSKHLFHFFLLKQFTAINCVTVFNVYLVCLIVLFSGFDLGVDFVFV